MPPNFQVVSLGVYTIVGCLLAFGHAKHPRANVLTSMAVPIIYGWTWFAFDLHPRLTSKMEQMYQRSLVRHNRLNLKLLCLEMMKASHKRPTYRCNLCGKLEDVTLDKYFVYRQYENGRRYRIIEMESMHPSVLSSVSIRVPLEISFVSLCHECVHHGCYDIFMNTFREFIKRRKPLVKRANLVRSLMMQRYFRQRLGNDLSGKIMSFVCWTPEVEIS